MTDTSALRTLLQSAIALIDAQAPQAPVQAQAPEKVRKKRKITKEERERMGALSRSLWAPGGKLYERRQAQLKAQAEADAKKAAAKAAKEAAKAA